MTTWRQGLQSNILGLTVCVVDCVCVRACMLLTFQCSYGGQREGLLFLKVIADLFPGGTKVGLQDLLDVVRYCDFQVLQLAGKKQTRIKSDISRMLALKKANKQTGFQAIDGQTDQHSVLFSVFISCLQSSK